MFTKDISHFNAKVAMSIFKKDALKDPCGMLIK